LSLLMAMTALATLLNLRVALKRFISFRLMLRFRPDKMLGEARIWGMVGGWVRWVGGTGEDKAG